MYAHSALQMSDAKAKVGIRGFLFPAGRKLPKKGDDKKLEKQIGALEKKLEKATKADEVNAIKSESAALQMELDSVVVPALAFMEHPNFDGILGRWIDHGSVGDEPPTPADEADLREQHPAMVERIAELEAKLTEYEQHGTPADVAAYVAEIERLTAKE